ncbi:MAG: glycosyl transferase [Candidatus Omnitrophica bacterium CG11_big_fil_rev_8_21_14_0_20_45_26]|uniref:Glycosyl transferase n=1 Tax=Candidatus Abzuiibacterium crystallinum TaxID=1974748 RepID=A0A2H0LQX6_9BACT|nr:MAG: glycosyl transferase [Candidatus Omnitrophica bacterium CG11_big_fil_rev_8_21_14_0_20_45_26]PIW64669.1 MAG: glycosyl transferase [Candidatus Omnitrophica bacterium CG12_big_fil_rev_8_21_14_0_65_45_16]
MRILHINENDLTGGAARSGLVIHTGLKSHGVDSRMLVRIKRTHDPDVQPIVSGYRWWIDRACHFVCDHLSLQYLYCPSSFQLKDHPWVKEADIIQLFNIHGSYFSYRALPSLSHLKPVVWRLSDMWSFTGHCGYSYECERWKTGCGACPHLSAFPPLYFDTSALHWRLKKEVYAKSKMIIVTPSRWMHEKVKQSPLLSHFESCTIPNGIDIETFQAIDKLEARRKLGINAADQKIILFSAHFIHEKRKGFSYLIKALESFEQNELSHLTLMVVGNGAKRQKKDLPCHTITMEHIDDPRQMALIYSAADIFALPTLADNLPNAVLESMACGTPVVAFDSGGIAEVVKHGETGYVVPVMDVTALAKGILTLASQNSARYQMATKCRNQIKSEFSQTTQLNRFMDLYRSILNKIPH